LALVGTPKAAAERYIESAFVADGNLQPSGHIMGRPEPSSAQTSQKPRRVASTSSALRSKEKKSTDLSSGFGIGGASITSVELKNEQGNPADTLTGGEIVSLVIRGRAKVELRRPIVGFSVKNNTGQALFGDNTYRTYQHSPPIIAAGQALISVFRFQMPLLPTGAYAITCSIAEGTQQDHVQHHWLHEALVFRTVGTTMVTGLVGIPMISIQPGAE
jgi:lipopolysaccharide transport system ATP-binding protein